MSLELLMLMNLLSAVLAAVLSTHRGHGQAVGFLLGLVVGPVGLGIVAIRRPRLRARLPVTGAD